MRPTATFRRTRTLGKEACLRPLHLAPRVPSAGLMPNLAAGPSAYGISVRYHVRAPHPFEPHTEAFRVREDPLCCPTLRPLGSPCGSPRRRGEDASHRPVQPTFDTSTQKSDRLLSPSSSRCRDRLRDVTGALTPRPSGNGARPPCGNPTPGGSALDGAPPASDETPASLLFKER
jgi:hypothetical protein